MFKLHTKNLPDEVEVRLCNLPTLRQAFVVASSLIIVSYLLEHFVSPLFHWLPLLVAGGLMFSGLVGFCPMVHILQKLPWNKS